MDMEDSATKNYIVGSGYKTLKEFDKSLGAPSLNKYRKFQQLALHKYVYGGFSMESYPLEITRLGDK